MDLAQLRAMSPESGRQTAEAVRGLTDMLVDVVDRVATEVARPLRDVWQGMAADAALDRIDQTARQATARVERLALLEQEVHRLNRALEDAQDLIKRADRAADQEHLRIKPDGSIEFPTTDPATSEAEQHAMADAAREVAVTLQRAIDLASSADADCVNALGPGPLSALAHADHGNGQDGFWDRARGALGDFFDFEMDFDNSPLGEWWGEVADSDNSILERIFPRDPDGQFDVFGDMTEFDENAFSEVFGGTPDELFGEQVVDRVHEEGLASLPDAMWDDFYEGVTSVDDRVSDGWQDLQEGWDSFTDDPVGSLGRAFGIG